MSKKPFKLDEDISGLDFGIGQVPSNNKDAPPVLVDKALSLVFRQMRSTGRRPRTIESYEYIFNQFVEAAGVKYVHDIDSDGLYRYIERLNVGLSTKLIRLKTVKAVLSRFFDNGWLPHKFWTNINIRTDKEVKQSADEADIELLLNVIDKSSFTGFRDAVAILLLYRTGIRITTLGNLREKHIDFDRLELNLDGSIMKGRTLLKLPIDQQIADNLKRLILENDKVREHYGLTNDYIFITFRGNGINHTNSNTNVISRQLSKYSNMYGLENINSHAIRRAYAKNLLNNGANIALISKALGHKDLSTTTQYLHLDEDEVSKSLREFL